MDGLTKRQTEFILACFKAQQAQQGTFGDPGYFNHVRAGIDAGFSKGECFDLVHLLAEYKPSLMEVHRTSKEIEGNVSRMTGVGREVAREILAGGAQTDEPTTLTDTERRILFEMKRASGSGEEFHCDLAFADMGIPHQDGARALTRLNGARLIIIRVTLGTAELTDEGYTVAKNIKGGDKFDDTESANAALLVAIEKRIVVELSESEDAGLLWSDLQLRIGYPRRTLERAVATARDGGWMRDNACSVKITEQGRRAAENIQKNLEKPLPAAPARGTVRV